MIYESHQACVKCEIKEENHIILLHLTSPGSDRSALEPYEARSNLQGSDQFIITKLIGIKEII